MLAIIGTLIIVGFSAALVYALFILLLKNIFKVAGILLIGFIILIYMAATDQLPHPTQEHQNQIISPVSN